MSVFINNYNLKNYTTWQCGGACALFAEPKNIDDLVCALKQSNDYNLPIYALGGGSNVLIQDGALQAAVISSAGLNSCEIKAEDNDVLIEAGAGISTKKLLEISISRNLSGLEFLAGIPGTLGGALFGNAGAGGVGVASLVKWAETAAYDCTIQRWHNDDLRNQYRTCPWQDKHIFVTKIALSLKQSNRSCVIENIRHYAGLKKGQPIGAKTAGCVFKNPVGVSAGKLLDMCGCKGEKIGGAVVSDAHANFIENCGRASSNDIYRLAELCRRRVFDRYGIKLEYEVKFFGAFSS